MYNYLIIALSLLASYTVMAQGLSSGQWGGQIHYEERPVPFEFEVLNSGKGISIVLINADERKKIDNVVVEGDSIFIPMGVFDAEIKAVFTQTTMSGEWVKHYRDTAIPFSAVYNQPRYKSNEEVDLHVANRWKVTFKPPEALEYPGVGLLEQHGSTVTGTVMTGVSDFRFFEGVVTNDSIKLSSFDGAHAFLMVGAKTDKGWAGDFYFDNGYKEEWVAVADDNAELPDPWEVVRVEKEMHRPFYDILAAGSGPGTLDESDYFNKVLVIQLFGSWCPNSLDETHYLIDWYNANKDKAVEILSVAYEPNYSREYGLQRITEYKKGLSVPYEIVLGGQLSKSQAALAFPFMSKIEAFPTLVIVDKNGFVRYVHSYFNGPATGPYYKAFDERFNEVIDGLLAE